MGKLPRPPSLNALRFFEATARHLSFTKAAAELNVTQAAVSRQVREIETALLHEDDGRSWRNWFAAAGVAAVDSPHRVRLNDVALVLQAAVDGQGVALGDDLLAGDDLQSGRLIMPFDIRMPVGSYWLLRDRSPRTASAQRAFHNWLQAELASTPSVPG